MNSAGLYFEHRDGITHGVRPSAAAELTDIRQSAVLSQSVILAECQYKEHQYSHHSTRNAPLLQMNFSRSLRLAQGWELDYRQSRSPGSDVGEGADGGGSVGMLSSAGML